MRLNHPEGPGRLVDSLAWPLETLDAVVPAARKDIADLHALMLDGDEAGGQQVWVKSVRVPGKPAIPS
jgi:hypothetical protein